MLCSVPGIPGEAIGYSQMSLQLPQATSSFEIWTGNPDSRDAGRIGIPAVFFP